MKRTFLLIIALLAIICSVQAQTITTVVPGQVTVNTTVELTITGSGVDFRTVMGDSLVKSMVTQVRFFSGSNSFTLTPYSEPTQTILRVMGKVPDGLVSGNYNVEVTKEDFETGDLIIWSGTEKLQVIGSSQPKKIVSIVPNTSPQGSTVNVTITAQNVNLVTFLSGIFSEVALYKASTQTTILAQSYNPVENTLKAKFVLPQNASIGEYIVKVTNETETIQSDNAIFNLTAYVPDNGTIVSVAPDQAVKGTAVDLTITGSNVNFKAISNDTALISKVTKVKLYRTDDTTVFYLTPATIVSETVMTATGTVPNYVAPGYYNIEVTKYNFQTTQSTVWSGTQKLHVIPATLPTKVVSITPNTATQGSGINVVIVGQNINFQTFLSGATPSVYLFRQSTETTIQATSYTAIENSINVQFNFAIDAAVGEYYVKVSNGSEIIQSDNAIFNLTAAGSEPPNVGTILPSTVIQGDSIHSVVTCNNINFNYMGTKVVSEIYLLLNDHKIPLTFSIISSNQLQVSAKTDAQTPIGSYSVNLVICEQSSSACSTYIRELLFSVAAAPASVSLNPSTFVIGDTGPITMDFTNINENMRFTNQPYPSVYLYLGSNQYLANSVQVNSPTNITAQFTIPASEQPNFANVVLMKGSEMQFLESDRLEVIRGDQIISVDIDTIRAGEMTAITMSTQGVDVVYDNIQSVVLGQETLLKRFFSTTDQFTATSFEVVGNNKIKAYFDIPQNAQQGVYSPTVTLKDNTKWYYGKVSGVTIKGVNNVSQDNTIEYLRVTPNPSNGDARIEFSLKTTHDVVITIVSTDGQVCSMPLTMSNIEGEKSLALSAFNLASGSYIVTMEAGGKIYQEKFVVAE